MIWIAAFDVAQLTGCPPKVVRCPKIGSIDSVDIISFEDINAAKGIPPPSAFPNRRISGITSKCSKANNFPVRPIPV